MTTELHVLAGTNLLESFRLFPGIHCLGSSAAADLLLASRDAPEDVARIDVSPAGEVSVRAFGETQVCRPGGESSFELPLRCGETVDVAGLRLVLLVSGQPRETGPDEGSALPPTAPSSLVRPPAQETLALRVDNHRSVQTLRLDVHK